MKGVPENLDLTPLLGTRLDYISLGLYQIGFAFAGEPGTSDCVITVEGRWELRDTQGALLDRAMEHGERNSYRIHRLLGRTLVDTRINPPESFTLIFDDGLTLSFIDDLGQYECCHILLNGVETHF